MTSDMDGVILAIDTSSTQTSIALSTGEYCYEESGNSGQSHSEDLTQLVASVFQKAGCQPGDCSRIIVGKGPGSFTGLRIGFSYARGFALAANCQMSTVSSLFAAGYEFRDKASSILVCEDARREEFFTALYHCSDQEVSCVAEPQILSRSEVLTLCNSNDFIRVVSPGNPAILSEDLEVSISEHMARSLIEISQSLPVETEEYTGNTAIERSVNIAKLEPEYIRPVAAKTIAERAQKNTLGGT